MMQSPILAPRTIFNPQSIAQYLPLRATQGPKRALPSEVRGMSLHRPAVPAPFAEPLNEKNSAVGSRDQAPNPVVESATFTYKRTNLVKIDPEGVRKAAKLIYEKLVDEAYSPNTWRSHPLHLVPPYHYLPADPRTKASLDWIFLISSLNFSFWSSTEGTDREPERFAVEWRQGWGLEKRTTWTGYWSLLAAVNKALEDNIPITDPAFYASTRSCPDALIQHIFRPASNCVESIPLLSERIAVMREVGAILNSKFGGSYAGLLSHFMAKYSGNGTALQLVQMIIDEFPSFRDESRVDGRKVYFWKRAQILVAETWAAFFPPSNSEASHPFLPNGIGQLTMFADYRVPQILHHLQIITYPAPVIDFLRSQRPLPYGSTIEVSIRAASILAVEALCKEIARLSMSQTQTHETLPADDRAVAHKDFPSVIIDFFLWDLAKKLERGDEKIDGVETNEMIPSHRTRSIWY